METHLVILVQGWLELQTTHALQTLTLGANSILKCLQNPNAKLRKPGLGSSEDEERSKGRKHSSQVSMEKNCTIQSGVRGSLQVQGEDPMDTPFREGYVLHQ